MTITLVRSVRGSCHSTVLQIEQIYFHQKMSTEDGYQTVVLDFEFYGFFFKFGKIEFEEIVFQNCPFVSIKGNICEGALANK